MTAMLTDTELHDMQERGEYPTLAQLGRMEYNKARRMARSLNLQSEFQKAYPNICSILITQFDGWVEQTLSAA